MTSSSPWENSFLGNMSCKIFFSFTVGALVSIWKEVFVNHSMHLSAANLGKKNHMGNPPRLASCSWELLANKIAGAFGRVQPGCSKTTRRSRKPIVSSSLQKQWPRGEDALDFPPQSRADICAWVITMPEIFSLGPVRERGLAGLPNGTGSCPERKFASSPPIFRKIAIFGRGRCFACAFEQSPFMPGAWTSGRDFS